MSLGNKQRQFTLMYAKLIIFAYEQGYELTCGDVYRDPRLHGEHGTKKGYGSSKSVHKLRIAGDLNLFIDGKYITSSDHPAWIVLHDYWESLGGATAVPNDANHFSLEMWGCK